MSVEARTSLASCPRAWPSWEPNARPPIWENIPSIGPAIARASSGRPWTHMPLTCSATGSHRRFHVPSVLSSQSTGVHATVRVAPAGNVVAPSSHSSAKCAASRTASADPDETGVTEPICWRASLAATS